MHLVFLFILGAVWGGSFLFLRVGTPELGPFVVTMGRLYLATFCFFIYVVFIKKISLRGLPWRRLILLGLLNSATPFTLIGAAEIYLTASLGSILNATTPIFSTLLAMIFLKEAQKPTTFVALFIGFLGVLVIVGWQPLALSWPVALAISASLCGALFYGIGGLYAARAIKGVPPMVVALGQLIGASLILTPFGLWDLPHAMPSTASIMAVIALGVLSTGVAYLCYFNLIHLVGPTKTLSVTYLIPVFGILWGVLFLGESVQINSIIGLGLILSGVLILNIKK